MKKLLICLSLGMLLTTGAFVNTTAEAYADSAPPPAFANDFYSAQPRAEQKEWRFRILNGIRQKRLWSITYGKWLTDWEPA